jgi:hypothetical protein
VRPVLSDLNNRSDCLDLLKWFETVNNKGINEINVYFNGFNRFDI